MWALVVVLVSSTSFATVINQVTISDQFGSEQLCETASQKFIDQVDLSSVTPQLVCVKVK
jgi:hypothetical protein